MRAVVQQDLAPLVALLKERFGLNDDAYPREWLEVALCERMRASGERDPARYLARLPFAAGELTVIAGRLTVGETHFFRHAEQLDACCELALPARLAAGAGQPVRVLSAGCATGEEAYSLAMLIRRQLGPQARERARIDAFDLDERALAIARQGRYDARSLRFAPAGRWGIDGARPGEAFVVPPELRELVRFEQRNLLDAAGPADRYDLIFCRNVLIYFSAEAKRRALARLADMLAPGGYLFLGPAESPRGLSEAFEIEHAHGAFFFRRAAAAAPPRDPGRLAPARRVPATLGPARTFRPEPLALADALSLFERERYDALVDRLSDLAPCPSALLAVRALALLGLGRTPEAEASGRAMLAQADTQADGHFILALARERAGDPLSAIWHHERAGALDPGFAMPHLQIGLLARRLGDPVTSRQELACASALIAGETPLRVRLYGGGFSLAALKGLCHDVLAKQGGAA